VSAARSGHKRIRNLIARIFPLSPSSPREDPVIQGQDLRDRERQAFAQIRPFSGVRGELPGMGRKRSCDILAK